MRRAGRLVYATGQECRPGKVIRNQPLQPLNATPNAA